MNEKITTEARLRLMKDPPPKVLRAMSELEILLLESRAKKLRKALDEDTDRLPNNKGWGRDE